MCPQDLRADSPTRASDVSRPLMKQDSTPTHTRSALTRSHNWPRPPPHRYISLTSPRRPASPMSSARSPIFLPFHQRAIPLGRPGPIGLSWPRLFIPPKPLDWPTTLILPKNTRISPPISLEPSLYEQHPVQPSGSPLLPHLGDLPPASFAPPASRAGAATPTPILPARRVRACRTSLIPTAQMPIDLLHTARAARIPEITLIWHAPPTSTMRTLKLYLC